MDVTVSHLNHRLALRLPTELPLGLVFVTGKVANVRRKEENGRSSSVTFDLIEGEHHIFCLLSERAATETNLREGDVIRAGGHLAFDTHRAGYYLLARDIEVVETADSETADLVLPTIDQNTLRAVLADVQKRAEASKLTPAELPLWLKKLAHLEEGEDEEGETAVPQPTDEPQTSAELSPSPEMVAMLLAAMDSQEEVELTPEMASQMTPATPPPVEAAQAYHVPVQAEEPTKREKEVAPLHSSYHPPSRRQVERSHAWWIVILLLATLILILAILSSQGFF